MGLNLRHHQETSRSLSMNHKKEMNMSLILKEFWMDIVRMSRWSNLTQSLISSLVPHMTTLSEVGALMKQSMTGFRTTQWKATNQQCGPLTSIPQSNSSSQSVKTENYSSGWYPPENFDVAAELSLLTLEPSTLSPGLRLATISPREEETTKSMCMRSTGTLSSVQRETLNTLW